jgi:hypothetical protein
MFDRLLVKYHDVAVARCVCILIVHPNILFSPPPLSLSLTSVINLQSLGGSKALVVAAAWTGMIHLLLGVLGTFVLKRFPTSFSVGFFLGVLVILANQNLILFGTFSGYQYGTASTNKIFASVGFTLFVILSCFSVLVFHFKEHIVVAPIDAKGLTSTNKKGRGRGNTNTGAGVDDEDPPSSYMQYDESTAA